MDGQNILNQTKTNDNQLSDLPLNNNFDNEPNFDENTYDEAPF